MTAGFTSRTSVQHDVVDHIALVFGVIEAEGAAQIFGDVFRFTAAVTRLHMQGEAVPVTGQRQRLKGKKEGLCCPSLLFGLYYNPQHQQSFSYLQQVKKVQSLHLKSFLPPWRSL